MTVSRWWFPDHGFSGRQLDQAQAYVQQIPERDRIVAALVTGSPAAGLGHARSDLDLFLVFATEEDRAGYDTRPRHHEDLVIDIRALTVAHLERLRETVRARDTTKELDRSLFKAGDLIAWAELVRLVIGTVVHATPDARALIASLDRDAVRRSVMVVHGLHVGSFVEDVEGAVECGDLATAVAAAEQAVRQALEVALAALGDLYVDLGQKFLQRRMARHPHLAELLDEHGERMLGQPAASCADDEVRRLVHWRLWLANHLVGQSLVTAWDAPAVGLPSFEVLDGGPVRSPYLVPLRWAGGYGLLTGIDIVHQLSTEDVELWISLDGRPLDDHETVDAWRAAGITW